MHLSLIQVCSFFYYFHHKMIVSACSRVRIYTFGEYSGSYILFFYSTCALKALYTMCVIHLS